MHADLAKLIVLQAQDIEARRLRDAMAALPKRIAALEAAAKATVGQRAVVLDLIQKEEAMRRRLESDVKDLQQKVERTKKKIDLATNTVQVTALEHEAAFARAEIVRLEDAELEGMERSEALEAQRALADLAVADASATYEREKALAVQTLAADSAALAEVDRRRKAMRAEVLESPTGDAALSTYDRIAHAKGTAVSDALNQRCSACQMMIRPQRWNDLRDNSAASPSAQTMMTCENCGRLLFYDPARDSPQRKLVEVESIAASIVRSL
jgi:predicted  nucleic acid-binding Zn-ribbon protein